ncbi:hypothetical protein TSMEX_002675 [Taenia solium]|eukprot:TsM_000770100 transcript=TsM_000770100 gene=TsM_000770100
MPMTSHCQRQVDEQSPHVWGQSNHCKRASIASSAASTIQSAVARTHTVRTRLACLCEVGEKDIRLEDSLCSCHTKTRYGGMGDICGRGGSLCLRTQQGVEVGQPEEWHDPMSLKVLVKQTRPSQWIGEEAPGQSESFIIRNNPNHHQSWSSCSPNF